MRRLLPTLLLVLAAFAVPAAADDDVSGLYAVAGKSPAGKGYGGAVKIVPYGNAHAVLWKLDDGEAYKGLALRKDDVLGATYGRDKIPGLVVYHIAGGTLEGDWISGGGKSAKEEIGRETLQGSPDLEGEYQITLGENQDGTTNYTGKVVMKRDGDTYVLVWMVPKPAYVGRGVRVGNVLVVAFGQDLKKIPGVVAYHVAGQTLDGVWALGPSSKIGRETLTLRPPQ